VDGGIPKGKGVARLVSIAEILSAKEKLKEAEKQYKKAPKKKQQPKDYLSQHEREEVILLAAIAGKLEEFISEWCTHQRPQRRITYAKTALTYIYKCMDSFFEGLTEQQKIQQVNKMIRALKQCNIYLERVKIDAAL